MRHCCQFNADDIYYLEDTEFYSNRTLSIGFCPICNKPVAELKEVRFSGGMNKISASGINAQTLMQNCSNAIIYSMKEVNLRKTKTKPYGWKYGINKGYKSGKVRQYACDFYGNKELIKK